MRAVVLKKSFTKYDFVDYSIEEAIELKVFNFLSDNCAQLGIHETGFSNSRMNTLFAAVDSNPRARNWGSPCENEGGSGEQQRH